MFDSRRIELFCLKVVVAVDTQVLERLCREQVFHIRIDTNRYSDTALIDHVVKHELPRKHYSIVIVDLEDEVAIIHVFSGIDPDILVPASMLIEQVQETRVQITNHKNMKVTCRIRQWFGNVV